MNLAKARILVTNDDGIHAPGLAIMEKIARTISKDVWVVAPEVEQSGASHSLSLRTPLRLAQLGPKRFAVNGTPSDCVLTAVHAVVKGKIDLVLSGVNLGQNIADGITNSGTVAAATEGALCNIPSIALSQAFNFGKGDAGSQIYWKTAEKFAAPLIRKLLESPWERDTVFNINFPDCPPAKVKGTKLVAQGKHRFSKQLAHAMDPIGRPYYWVNWKDEGFDPRRPEPDIKWLFKNFITVTPLCLDLTNYGLMERLKGRIES